jgi:hypothetical protein
MFRRSEKGGTKDSGQFLDDQVVNFYIDKNNWRLNLAALP